MNCFIPENPQVVVLDTIDAAGNRIIEFATNVAPETKVTFCDTKEDFEKASLGLPFNSTQ